MWHTIFQLFHVGFVAVDASKLHSILQVRTKSVIYYASNTIIVEFSEKYIMGDSVKCLLQVKKYSTSILPRITGLLNFLVISTSAWVVDGVTVPKTKLCFK